MPWVHLPLPEIPSEADYLNIDPVRVELLMEAKARTAGVEITVTLTKEEADEIRKAIDGREDRKVQELQDRLGETVWRAVYDVVMRKP